MFFQNFKCIIIAQFLGFISINSANAIGKEIRATEQTPKIKSAGSHPKNKVSRENRQLERPIHLLQIGELSGHCWNTPKRSNLFYDIYLWLITDGLKNFQISTFKFQNSHQSKRHILTKPLVLKYSLIVYTGKLSDKINAVIDKYYQGMNTEKEVITFVDLKKVLEAALGEPEAKLESSEILDGQISSDLDEYDPVCAWGKCCIS